MHTIKGPVTIKPGKENKEFIGKLKEAGVKVKLPFKAKGWKSTKTPEIADMEGIELAKPYKEAVKEAYDEPKKELPFKKKVKRRKLK